MSHYLGNIASKAIGNVNYREVVHTGQKMQLVVMSLEPGEEIGEEIHADHDQFIRIERGHAKAILSGTVYDLAEDDSVIVPAGMRHNIVNDSDTEMLKLSTIYAPPEHRPGTVHPRRADER